MHHKHSHFYSHFSQIDLIGGAFLLRCTRIIKQFSLFDFFSLIAMVYHMFTCCKYRDDRKEFASIFVHNLVLVFEIIGLFFHIADFYAPKDDGKKFYLKLGGFFFKIVSSLTN